MRNTGEANTMRFVYRRKTATGWISLAAGAALLGGLLHALPAKAVEFGDGAFTGSLDTTISHGMTFRVEDRDDELAADTNGNDGNLNYDRGIVSNASKFTTDLDIGFGDFGAFVRATGFIDFENQDGERDRTALSDAAKERVGSNVELLDAYVTGEFDVSGIATDLRLGWHVLNWGESTFIPNGINAINPFDVSKLRLPGSELREALLPVGMASASVAPTDTLTLEGFYQLDWEKTVIDPVGSYFSVTDYVGPGARKAVIPLPGVSLTDMGLSPDSTIGFERLIPAINADFRRARAATQAQLEQQRMLPPGSLDGLVTIPGDQPATDADFLSVLRRPADEEPGNAGQWGVALRYYAEELNDTEFGLYFVNYHSRLPIVSANTGTLEGIQSGLAAAQAVGAQTSATVAALGQAVAQAVTPAVTEAVTQQVTAAVRAGMIAPADAPARIAAEVQRQVTQEVGRQVAGAVPGIASALAVDRYAKSGRYFVEYPENLQLFGVSFNTALGSTGWALQGEYSLRPDTPLQRAEDALFAEGLAPMLRVLDPRRPDYVSPQGIPAYLGGYRQSKVQGYIERNVSQVQVTATRVFGPTLGADSLAFIAEAALMHVHDMPDKNASPLESPAGGILDTEDAYADATSWGYRFVAQLGYSNVIDAVNLRPYVQFLHDVSGNSPAPSGPFVEGRTAITIGLRADYLESWQASLGYTRYAGDGNELADRDFVSFSVKYSF
ncbi:MAG: DUF1302 domain-containing protein [Defluviicoccus sp.]|nr:DUF1302 domain-containing protein [Defluviicoccus sp.]MDE0384642.1 DUF1302 domain-containing protein [Defluviicoccus sp.]